MSNWPVFETQPAEPVSPPGGPPVTTQGAPSGVPRAAACHSAFVGSRFPAFRAAAVAWNQVMCRDGVTPGMDTA